MAVAEGAEQLRARILIADDVEASITGLAGLLAEDGHEILQAADGVSALDIVRRERPDIVITDIQMPGMGGLELCQEIKSDPATRLVPVILITGILEHDARVVGIRAGADDFLLKPVRGAELRARVHALIRLKRYTDELDSVETVMLSLAATVEARDRYTSGHCERMATYAADLGLHLGLSSDEVLALRRGGYLHDLGKIAIPDAILLKPGSLTTPESDLMRQHAVIGDSLCGGMRLLRLVRPIVRHHHERLDGSGYPDGLRGDDIPLLAQIMGVVDVYDALTTARPYRGALLPEAAFEALDTEVQNGWRSRELVSEFVTMQRARFS